MKRGARMFHYCLKRPIHPDDDFRGPISLPLLKQRCGGGSANVEEATHAAHVALEARLHFWDGVLDAIGREPSGTP